ncbi:MAG: hypothetical protein NVS2B12_23550 [Ktedonobacteraceae bacterium]
MAKNAEVQQIVEQKLAAFERLQAEFEACFQFIEDVHGQQRFSIFSVTDIVYYLHALWIGECKTALLSVAKTVKEYEGRWCLDLLQKWQQEEDTGSIVAFLQHKLDMLPLADITRQIHKARRTHSKDGLAQRLLHGRIIMLNRGINLMTMLDTLFAVSEQELAQKVQHACEQYKHRPEQIVQQLAEMDTPLYSFVPHQSLAQRNMLVMNKLGVNVAQKPADLPGQRSWRVMEPTEPLSPFAEQVVQGYQELTAPARNNVRGERFVDRPEPGETGTA